MLVSDGSPLKSPNCLPAKRIRSAGYFQEPCEGGSRCIVVFDPPGLNEAARFVQCFEPMNVEAFVTKGPVECLDKGVVRRLTRAREVDPDRMVIGP